MRKTIADMVAKGNPTVEMFENWLTSSPPGGSIIYHTGLLAADRYGVLHKDAKPVVTAKSQQVDRVASFAWAAYQNGLVCLVQERFLGETYYIAVKRGRKR